MKKLVNGKLVYDRKKASPTVLLKSLLFVCLNKLNEAYCYRCKKPIEDIMEMSLDHKIRHEGNEYLLWDPNNLTISHFTCNVKANGASEKHWITNGIDNKLVLKDKKIPKNWYKGRTL